ncbi:MAG: hypothetical protein ACOX7Z_06640 [Dysosmobacter sp.]|jgi:hypothetical protein|uniref:hypothetical protein n=1 Tax=Dysosmobacter sp. TaxID=2591382 RepID=UPI00267367E8|nr:hypothetical protein [Dysosmobacter sp.]MCI6015786.1 hypothetical protein [Dysosmobacter sp.]
MKEKRFQILSLALNVVLLIALFATRAELVDKQTILKSKLDDISYRLSNMDDRITNLSAKQREQTEDLSDFSFEPTGLDPESHMLQANMNITLRRWAEDTAVTLLITQNGQTEELPMTGTDGVFATPVGLPVEQTGEVSFAANITAGGQTSREEVTGYSDLAVLLPLQYTGGGYGGPEYRGGTLEFYSYDVSLVREYGAEIIDPVFQILKNGTAVQRLTPELAELTEDDTRDVVDYILKDRLRVECAKGDTVEFHLLCRDSFGLSYDFTVCTYEIDQDGTMVEEVWPVTDYNVEVSWD